MLPLIHALRSCVSCCFCLSASTGLLDDMTAMKKAAQAAAEALANAQHDPANAAADAPAPQPAGAIPQQPPAAAATTTVLTIADMVATAAAQVCTWYLTQVM
jgi:hypothetical protein